MSWLPQTPTEPYWECPEAKFAHLVMATDDPRAWKALEQVAKRSDVGLPMEFLAAFLDDADVPDRKARPEMFSGPHTGFTFERVAVQDFAAMKIASLLDMPDRPDRDWTPRQWEKLRRPVKEALHR